MSVVISVEHLSKSYRLGVINTGTFRGDVHRWWAKLRGQPDPHLKIGEKDHGNRDGETIWALKDVNLEVKQGEVLGIIGRNGAGKSTLLKILSRVTAPTSGEIKLKGRIASLLEVGTGFHPELTGRENIYLNGVILGMKKSEISRKLDEIVDFSGVEQFIDTPVKRYSSGMYVRLAFAVAAHLEPEILVVDEVLAVGDAEFQKKCLGKMKDVAGLGRTVLFVSHNIASIKLLCHTGILLVNGEVAHSGHIDDVVTRYLQCDIDVDRCFVDNIGFTAHYLTIDDIRINDTNHNTIKLNCTHSTLRIAIRGVLQLAQRIGLELRICDRNHTPLAFYSPGHYLGVTPTYPLGNFAIEHTLKLPKELNRGRYYINIYLTNPGVSHHMVVENAVLFDYEGYPTKTGHTFEYDKGAGFLFLT